MRSLPYRYTMLELTLELNRATLEATFVLANTGPEPVLVNRRLTLNHPAELEECRQVYLRLRDQAGAEPPFAAFLTVRELTLDDFASLAPGQSVKQTYSLQNYYALARPGQYSIQAFYENAFDTTKGEAWKGTLESNTVTFDL